MPKRQIVFAKKQIYDGIKFDSGLEVTMYKLLKKHGFKFEREGHKFVVFPKMKLSNGCWERPQTRSKSMKDRRAVREITYTPDFVDIKGRWIIECKGRANEQFPIKWKLFKLHVSQMKKPPMIFKPTNEKDCQQVIEVLIKNKLR